jgi:hypothetical protein
MIKTISRWLIFILVMLVSFRISQSRSLSMRFVDEEDHIAFGYYINQGYKLHQQLQNNHQPLVYFASAGIQKLTHPENIFMLVRRHRQVMFFYGLAWSLIFLLRFKSKGLFFIVFIELLKYYLFGNLLLLDSLAAYPAAYLFFSAMKIWFNRFQPKIIELLWLGTLTWLIFFTLIPLWPWLAIIWLVMLFRLNKKVIYSAAVFLLLSTVLFSFYSPAAWWHETVYNNIKYAIPALNEIHSLSDRSKLVFFPFLAYFNLSGLQSLFIAVFFTGYLVAAVKDKRLWLIYPLLFLANTRVINPNAVYYQGFHLLPWLGLLIAGFIFVWEKIRFKPVFMAALVILLFHPAMFYRIKTDLANEYYINYSLAEDFNFAVRTLANSNDRLAVLDNKPLIYWQSNTRPATRQLVYYAWEPDVPELRAGYNQVFFGGNPPEIIYGDKEPALLIEKYTNIPKDSQSTLLFIRNDRYNRITPDQWLALATRGFSHEL